MSEYFSFSALTKHTLSRAESLNDIFNAVAAGFALLPSLATLTNYFAVATDASVSTNAYILTPQSPITAYAIGQQFRFVATTGNTGPCTVNVGDIGIVGLKDDDGTALASGDIPAGALVTIVYTGSEFRLAITGGVAETSNVTINDLGIGIGPGAAPTADQQLFINSSGGHAASAVIRSISGDYASVALVNDTLGATIVEQFSSSSAVAGLFGPNFGCLTNSQGPLSIGTTWNFPIYFGINNAIVGSIDTAGALNFPAFIPTTQVVPSNGVYLNLPNDVGISAGGVIVAAFSQTRVGVGTALGLFSRTVAQLGGITPTAGLVYYCSNEAGGAVMVCADGTNWRRVTDRAIIS